MRDVDGNARAIVPLYTAATRPVAVMRFIGHGPTDQLGPVCAPSDRALAAPVVAGVAAPLLIGDELPADPAWAAIPGAIVLDRPAILTPLVPLASALVGSYGTCDDALVDALTGLVEPRGRLPFDLPRSMEDVRRHGEDVPGFEDPLFRCGDGRGLADA